MPGERTEQATQHRREKARREGDILHSRELSAAAGTLAGAHGAGSSGRPDPGGLAQRLCRLSRARRPGPLGAGHAGADADRRCAA